MEDYYEKIKEYLAGKLKDQNLTDFKKELAENETFAREVKITQQLQQLMGSEEEEVLAFQKKALEIYRKQNLLNNKNNFPISQKTRRWLSIGLLISLGILLIWVFNQNNSSFFKQNKNQPALDNKITLPGNDTIISKEPSHIPLASEDTYPIIDINGDNHPEVIKDSKIKDDSIIIKEQVTNKKIISNTPYLALAKATYQPLDPTLRNGKKEDSTKTKSTIEKVQLAYNSGNMQKVVDLLTDPIPENQKTEWLKLRGHAYFQLDDFSKSATDFEAITNSPSYGNDAKWFFLLALAAQLPQEQDAFDSHLESFKKNSGGFLPLILNFENKLKSIDQ